MPHDLAASAASGHQGGMPDEIKAQCAELLRVPHSIESAKLAVDKAHAFALMFPGDVDANLTYVTLRELTRNPDGMLEQWTDLHQGFPECSRALRYRVRWLRRLQRVQEGLQLVETAHPGFPDQFARHLEKAELLLELKSYEMADICFGELISRYPDEARAKLQFARRLKERGALGKAWRTLEPQLPHPRLDRLAGEVKRMLETLQAIAPDRAWANGNICELALRSGIERFADRRAHSLPTDRLGATVLITGSLAAGGAERQMVRSAVELENARVAGQPICGVHIEGPVHVVVRSMTESNGGNFYKDLLDHHRVQAFEMDAFPTISLESMQIDDPALKTLIPLLPTVAIYGIQKLVKYFQDANTQVAFIWQDGAIILAAFAALIAKVPRIVLNMRGLPPNLRKHMHRPEYLDLYLALARVPGVEFNSNSKAAALAYCDWLRLAPERFAVIHNGVERPPAAVNMHELDLWRCFEEKTATARETIGSVFRFDTDKQPLIWIGFAKTFLKRRPDARFILVGDGRLLQPARALAQQYEIADRVLFVGLSKSIGFWLSKMQTLVLLSRFEGLPNVLIEAQLAGLPVVSTRAGGACEAFAHGVTGLACESAEDFDSDEVCDKVDAVLGWAADSSLGARVRTYAEQKFSSKTMLERTVRLLASRPGIVRAI